MPLMGPRLSSQGKETSDQDGADDGLHVAQRSACYRRTRVGFESRDTRRRRCGDTRRRRCG